MNDAELAVIRQFVLRRTGILLAPEKRYLVETRLDPLLREFAIPSLGALAARLRRGEPALETAVIDAMTTNETLFFRDRLPFEHFRNVILPELIAARRPAGRIRIWCAACSTGQEPYSLAMILDEMKTELQGIAVEIVATDISERVIAQAREGVYSQFEAQRGLPIRLLLKHFAQEGTRWRLNRDIASKVRFRLANLQEPFQALGRFDAIFCRNVLIYFGEATKREVLARLAEAMTEDGYLLLGGAETVLGLSTDLVPHRTERSLYVRAHSAQAQLPAALRQRIAAQAAVAVRA